MMATIIDCGDGRFIAGDPAAELGLGEHWCRSCGGDGLEYGWDDELEVCGECGGAGVVECGDTACPVHSSLHPASPEQLRDATIIAFDDYRFAAAAREDASQKPVAIGTPEWHRFVEAQRAVDRALQRYMDVREAWHRARRRAEIGAGG